MTFFSKAARLGAIVLAGLLLIGGIAAASLYFYLAPQLPSPEALRDVRYQVPLRVYTSDHKLLAEYGEMKRTPITFDDAPDALVQAILAAEDDRFFQHPGVDYQGLLRAAWILVSTGQKTQGGSTITMQVARNFFLGREKTYLRKFNEILLAFTIEQQFTKQEILELYLNKIYLGQRAYGVAAAAQVYYGVELPQLSVAQMAMIAGLPKAPSRYNPIADPERALTRRNYVLGRMRDLNFLTEEDYRAAIAEKDTARLSSLPIEAEAPYLAEQARAELFQRYGEDVYTTGMKVYTTLDTRLQAAANRALHNALLEYDRRHGYRGAEAHVKLPAQAGAEDWIALLASYNSLGGLVPALVVNTDRQLQVALRDGTLISVALEGTEWARRMQGDGPVRPNELAKPGDILRLAIDETGRARLAQIPEAEGALVALRPDDGAVLALVGGFDFYRSKFNRATQALRQPGSSFKPFVYSAALEHGMTPATVINDAPVVFDDPELESAWRPENYSGEFYGPTRLREALTHSRNLVSIRVLRATGIDTAIDYVSRFGFDKASLPRNLSLALGSNSVTPLNLAAGYTVFANGGYRVTPYFIDRIEDAQGVILWQAEPTRVCADCDNADPATTPAGADVPAATNLITRTAPAAKLAPRAISAQNAYLMTSMMKDVIRLGTAQRAAQLGRNDIAGKTGTTNDQRDAWFAGYSPAVATVAWVGFDDTRPLGNAETGGRAALPMWIDFMRAALQDVPDRPLEQPPGLVSVRIDPGTGLQAEPGEHDAMFETFFADNVPSTRATAPTSDAAGTQPGAAPSAIPEQLF